MNEMRCIKFGVDIWNKWNIDLPLSLTTYKALSLKYFMFKLVVNNKYLYKLCLKITYLVHNICCYFYS
jgi:hypothetical protein